MKFQKKYMVAGLIGLVTITGAVAYLQYKKLMDYTISFKNIKINKISANLLDFNIFINFLNKSTMKFSIESQKYDVYFNNVFIVTLENSLPTEIAAKSTSVIGLNIKLDPKKGLAAIGKNATSLITEPDKIIVKVVTKMKVKYGIFKVGIPYTYESTLKNMMA